MYNPNNLPGNSIAQIQSTLASLIEPHFRRGELTFSTYFLDQDKSSSYSDGNVTLSGTKPFARDTDYLDAADINFPETPNKYYTSMLKKTKFYIAETLMIPIENIKYMRLFTPLKHSMFNSKQYQLLYVSQPILANVDGKRQPVAKHTINLILPESECAKLLSYANKYPATCKLHIRFQGSAYLFGGHETSIGGRSWLEYYTNICVDQFAIGPVVD